MRLFKPVVVAFASVAVVALIRWFLDPMLGGALPFYIFFLAIMGASLLQGFWSGALATVLSFLAGTLFFVDPGVVSAPSKLDPRVLGSLFLIEGIVASGLGGWARRSRLQLLASRDKIHSLAEVERKEREQKESALDERNRIEEALKRSQSKLRRLFDANVIGVVFFHRDGRLCDANEYFLRLTGYTSEELHSGHLRWADITPPEWHEADRRGLEQLLARGSMDPFEKEYLHKDGRRIPVLLGGAMFEGNMDEGLAFVMDISERKRASEVMRASEERFRALTESIPQMVWVTDVGGSHIFFNRRWYEYTGHLVGESDGSGWQRALHPDDVERTVQVWKRCIASGENYEIQYRLRDKNGEYRWQLGRAVPVRDANGRIVQWFGTCTDIHEQKVVQQRMNETAIYLRRSQEELKLALKQTEVASRMKDEFLATLSHELRTPLAAILGWAELLTAKQRSVEVVQKGLETIHRNAVLQSELINDLLDVSRILSGKLRLAKEAVNLEDVMSSAIDSCRLGAEAKGIQIRTSLDESSKFVVGDSGRLQQVLWNLMTNAIKFTPKGGEIEVSSRKVNSSIEVRVRDTGEGIAPEFLPFVFERFRQADSSITRKHGGLGLGLAIVRHLVELHGGSVRAESAGVGQGASFIFSLPVAAVVSDEVAQPLSRTEADEAEAPASSIDLHGMRVLIVDDVRDTLDLLGQILNMEGARVFVADSAAQAMEVFKKEYVDLVISDIGMPGEDGYALLRRIRKFEKENGRMATPALALTAYARDSDVKQATDAGFDGHLAKPVTPNRLLMVLADLASKSAPERLEPAL